MTRLATALLVCALAGSAFAGRHQDLRIYLDLEPPGYLNQVEEFMGFDVYVCHDCFESIEGLATTSFKFERSFYGIKLSQECLLPEWSYSGDVEVDGWTLWAMNPGACACPDSNGIVVVGRVSYLPLDTVPGYIRILPHPVFGTEVADCYWESHYYCIYQHLGYLQEAPPGEIGCNCTPIMNANVGIALHVDNEGVDCGYEIGSCESIDTSWSSAGSELDFIVAVCNYPAGFQGVRYGLTWPADWSFTGWQSCADVDVVPFDGVSGHGVWQTWDSCIPPAVCHPYTVGVLSLFAASSGRVWVTPYPDEDGYGVSVSRCGYTDEDDVLPGNGRAGWVDVGGGQGCNPCLLLTGGPCWVPGSVADSPWESARSTWGAIKALYR
jgi:hypothetical protein